jgi:hypothetical protein
MATGLTSCTLIDLLNKKKCEGDEFTCKWEEERTRYKVRFCEDGWVASYEDGSLDDIDYSSFYTDHFDDMYTSIVTYGDLDSDISCSY